MEGGCGRLLEMRFVERPGHDMKCPQLMAVMKVDLTGLKDSAWNYLATSRLMVS